MVLAHPEGIAVLGAPSSIGIKPYDDGTVRHLDRAPRALREQGIVQRLRATDLGDVVPPPYQDVIRPPKGVRNEAAVARFSEDLAGRVASGLADGRFVLLLGGDCSIVLGALLGAGRHAGGPVGLAYVDAHADFATPEESATGSAASMCLAMAVGRGTTPLARLGGAMPLTRAEHTVLLGRRDQDEPYGHEGLAELRVVDVPYAEIRERGSSAVVGEALSVLTLPALRGFWVHVDADVLDASVMPAVDSPTPDGPDVDSLVDLVAPLAAHPNALGMQLTIYDPALDPDGACAARLGEFIERTLAWRVRA